MEAFLAAVEASDLAQALRGSWWGYAAVSGMHIFGIAFLVGAVVPLNLRLLGFWPKGPRIDLLPVLITMACAGFVIAALSGLLLLSVRAQDYAEIDFFQAKLVLIGLAIVSAVTIHRGYGPLLQGASQGRLSLHALVSLACWLGALACGRLIAFAE
jgi:hypothetical protein